ncbi:hypothetical protein [Rhodovulum sp. FJ3]|uniref:hypothetical protein n=1 Tax=Rhodovulum sp. FJ3 TaxID=3079053 RepID=UPI00293DB14F|nr:hypothetical protein [Rhodovulum sp. FJ3]MDV4169525.1 hypothetical protein [Rhodovulum sp. FJ3]
MSEPIPHPYRVRKGVLWSAVVLAPLVWGVPGAILFYVGLWVHDDFGPLAVIGFLPAVTMIAGSVPYLILGAPIIWHHAKRTYPNKRTLAKAGAVTNLCLTIVIGVGALILALEDIGGAIALFLFVGTPFAALWGATVAVVYKRLDGCFPANNQG